MISYKAKFCVIESNNMIMIQLKNTLLKNRLRIARDFNNSHC